jgi:hypothetical protein
MAACGRGGSANFFKLTGETPTSMHDFVKLHAAESRLVKTTAWAKAEALGCRPVPCDQ